METMERGKYGTAQAEALRAARDELPSLLPDGNPWKNEVEQHRWGYHHEARAARCPECRNARGNHE